MFMLAVCLWVPGTVRAQQAGRSPVAPEQSGSLQGTVTLDPKLLVQLLVARSAEIQYSRLQVEVAGHMRDGEAALYEAIFFGNLRREDRERQRGIEERQSILATSNLTVLDERVDSSEVGARNRLPTGGEVSLSYKMRDKRNNIIASSTDHDGEYDGALILTFKQPLLRGRGREVIETDRRIAEVEEKISVLQYKQQLLKTCNDALSVYWQLYRALEISRIRQQALENARQILRDTESRIEAGRVPASNGLEATAAVMVRDVERIRAEQGVREAESRLQTLLNISSLNDKNLKLVVGQDLVIGKPKLRSVEDRYQQALEVWPGYQIAKLRLEQGKFRLNFADNQRLPVLDLLVGRSNTGLSYQRDETRSITKSGKYPEWYVGFNLEVPLYGNQKAISQFRAQATRIRQAELELESVHNVLGNDIRTRWEQVEGAYQEVEQINRDVELRGQLLENERVRYEAGLGLLGQLLQREGELNESRQRMVESKTRLGQANAALMFADGSLLDEYGIILKE
jgi:outer membrane protein TolC